MSSAHAKSSGDAWYASQDPFIHCPIQSRLQSVLGVRSFYVERNYVQAATEEYHINAPNKQILHEI